VGRLGGAVQLLRVMHHTELPIDHLHPALCGSRIAHGSRGADYGRVQVEDKRTRIEADRQRGSPHCHHLGGGRKRKHSRDGLRMLLFIERGNSFLAQRVPRRRGAAGEQALHNLGIAPNDQRSLRSGRRRHPPRVCRSPLIEAGNEIGGQRLLLIGCGETVQTSIEGVVAGGGDDRVRNAVFGSMNVNDIAAARNRVARIHVENVTSQVILQSGVLLEIIRIAGIPRRAIVHHVDGDVTARDVIAVIEPGALRGTRVPRQQRGQIADLRRRERRRRKLAGSTGEIDILRLGALRTDQVAGVLSGAGGSRQSACQQSPHIDRLDIVSRQVDIEVEYWNTQIAPNGDVGQDCGGDVVIEAGWPSVNGNGVQPATLVDGEYRIPSVRVAEIDFEIRYEQRRPGSLAYSGKRKRGDRCSYNLRRSG